MGGHRSVRCRAQVLDMLQDQQEHVREYLELLRSTDRAMIDQSVASTWATAETAFTEVAKSFGRRHGIDVQTWVEVRVPLDVLRRAGFSLPDATESESSENSPR
jgi:hypothetical protein